MATQTRPNIVFILADDLGWMDTSLYGSDYFETPNIERMAKRGMMFTNAYAANPLCSPTRASIQTGQYPARLGLTSACGHLPVERLETELATDRALPHHKVVTPESITRLDLKYPTLGKVFKQAGYATGYMGKWHMGYDPYNAPQHGYDDVVGAGHFPAAGNVCPGGADGQHLDDFVTDKAIEFMESHSDESFLLMLNLYDVHSPFDGKPELIEKYQAKREPYSAPQSHPVYGAMVEEVDICVGRVMQALDNLGIADNTVLVFFSDNGGDMYDKPDGVLPTSNAPLRGGKANLFEGGTREPLVVVWPDRIPAGTRSDAFVSSIDFYPTFLELAGISLPETHHVDGISQIPVWCEDAESVREEVFCFFPHYTPATGQLPATSLRVGDWKLIRYFHDNPDQTHRYELFNLRDDLGETRNLAEKDPKRVENMDARIEDFLRDTECVVPVKHETYDRAVEEAYEGWRNAVVVHKERNELKRDKTGLNFDATSFGPAFICEEIPENSGELICAITLQSDSDGCGQITWYEQEAALPGNISFVYQGNPHMQTMECLLSCNSAIKALRLEPSRIPGRMLLGSVILKDDTGDVFKTWDFAQRQE